MSNPDAGLAGLGVLAGLSSAHRDLVTRTVTWSPARPFRSAWGRESGCSVRAARPRAAG